MHQPPRFVDYSKPDHVWCIKKSLYGPKQAPRSWFHRFASFLVTLGFVGYMSDQSRFVSNNDSDRVYLLLYVDDIVLTYSSTNFRDQFPSFLCANFPWVILVIWVIVVDRHKNGFFCLSDNMRLIFSLVHPCLITNLFLLLLKYIQIECSRWPFSFWFYIISETYNDLQYITFTRLEISYVFLANMSLHAWP